MILSLAASPGLAAAAEGVEVYALSYGVTADDTLRISFNAVNRSASDAEPAFVLELSSGVDGEIIETKTLRGQTVDAGGDSLFYTDFDGLYEADEPVARLYTQGEYDDPEGNPVPLDTLDIGVWRDYVSATTVSTANHATTQFNAEQYTFRTYVKPVQDYGEQAWRFFFSNNLDFLGGVDPGTPFRITEAFLADGGADADGSVVAGSSVRVTYDGENARDVAAGERFWSDEAVLDLPEDHWLCFTWTIQPLAPYTMDNANIPIASESYAKSYAIAINDDIDGYASQETSVGFTVLHGENPGWGIMPNLFGVRKPGARRLSFLGDSITQGVGTPKGGDENYWVAKVARGLAEDPATQDIAVYNAALSGSRGFEAAYDGAWLARLKQEDEITLVHGVNDLGWYGRPAADVIESITKMVRSVRTANPSAAITLFTVPAFSFAEEAQDDWREVNQWILSIPEDVDYVFDIAAVLEDPKNPTHVKVEYRSDNGPGDEHPGSIGCSAVAEAYLKWYEERDESPAPADKDTYQMAEDFSIRSSAGSVWSYQYVTHNQNNYTPLPTLSPADTSRGLSAAWREQAHTGSLGLGYVAAGAMSPAVSGNYDTAITFTAPRSGYVNVSSSVPITFDSTSTDGVDLKVSLGKETIWPRESGWKHFDGHVPAALDFAPMGLYLEKGDQLHFVLYRSGSGSGDQLRWNPVVEYMDASHFSGWELAANTDERFHYSQGWDMDEVSSTDAIAAACDYTFVGSALALHAPTGPSMGVVHIYIDGRLAGEADLYSPRETSPLPVFSTALWSGKHSVKIVCAGDQNVLSAGTGIAFSAFQYVSSVWEEVPSSESGIAYTRDDWQLFGNSYASDVEGASFEYSFTGGGVKWLGSKDVNCGIAKVYIDDTLVDTVDTYATETLASTVLYETADLFPGNHTIKVEVSGDKNPVSSGTTLISLGLQQLQPKWTWVSPSDPLMWYSSSVSAWNTQSPSEYKATVAGAYFECTLECASIAWMGSKWGGRGQADVYLDGAYEATVDLNENLGDLQQLWSATGLPFGEHTLKVVLTRMGSSEGMNLCGIEYKTDDSVESWSRLPNMDPKIKLYPVPGGRWSQRDFATFDTQDITPDRDTFFEYAFTGSAIAWRATTDFGRAQARILIDGVEAATVDQAFSPDSTPRRLYENTALSYGKHTIRVEAVPPQVSGGDGEVSLSTNGVEVIRCPESDLPYTMRIKSLEGGVITAGAADGLYQDGDLIPISAKPSAGYEFTGWLSLNGGGFEDAASVSTVFTMPDRDVMVLALFTPNENAPTIYDVKWNTNGGTPIPTQVITDSQSYIDAPADMKRAGYTFGGWYSDSALTQKVVFPVTNITTDQEFWAKWLKDVTFTAVERGGKEDVSDSQSIVLTFSAPIAGLTADHIKIDNDTGAVISGKLSGSRQTWTITLESVLKQGSVNITIRDFGSLHMANGPRTATVYRSADRPAPEERAFTLAQIGGVSGTSNTTAIQITFDDQVSGLTADDITITDGTGAVTLGALTTSDQLVYWLPVTVITEGIVGLSIKNIGAYLITTPEQYLNVYKGAGGSGGNGGGSASSTSDGEVNSDGSITKTVTDKATGTVTATTAYPDGTKVIVTTPKGGSTSIEVIAPSGKDSVTVTIPTAKRPTDSEVAIIVHEDGSREVVKNSVPTERGMRVTLRGSCNLEIVDNSRHFSDVPEGYWAYDAITFVSGRNLFNGGDSGFMPADAMSRAMFYTVLARLNGKDTSKGETWYSAAMSWAKETGISDGTAPFTSITREQLAVMLYRYAGSPEIGSLPFDIFPDAGDVSAWAGNAMLWAVNSGILKGSEGNLKPGGTATRAEVATMIMRFIEIL